MTTSKRKCAQRVLKAVRFNARSSFVVVKVFDAPFTAKLNVGG